MDGSKQRLDVLDIPGPVLLRIVAATTLLIALFRSTPMYVMGGEPFPFAARQFLTTMSFTLVLWVVNISLFQLMVPLAATYSKGFRIALSVAISILLGWLLVHFVMERIRPHIPAPGGDRLPPPRRGMAIFPVLQVVSVNLMILMVMELTMMKRARDRVARENDALKMAGLEARINALKAQLHPHFLFNALTTLKALNRQAPERTDLYIDELAVLLRSSLRDREALIPLHEEYELCTKYLSLQKLRFGDALEVELVGQVGREDTWLIPMYSLQQLAENAIKHNVLTTDRPLRLRIHFDAAAETVTTVNNLQYREDVDRGEGIGLRNLDERCVLLGLGPLRRSSVGQEFSVTINLKRA